jgi:hypothetical protein
VGSRKKGEVVFIGSSNEKGTFFEGEIELTAPFDIEKLELYYDEVDGEDMVNCVYYDGEEIENYGGSTDGKSSDINMVRITDDQGNWETYEPEEKDWGHPEYGTSPSEWERSETFKFKKTNQQFQVIIVATMDMAVPMVVYIGMARTLVTGNTASSMPNPTDGHSVLVGL